MELNDPKALGLPHATWRPHQRETVEWALDSKKTVLIEAPTGSGKTGLASAIAAVRPNAVALVRTKFLQVDNYAHGYDFVPLMGKSNYPCVHPNAKAAAAADECLYAEAGMNTCPYAHQCPYVLQRDLARTDSKTVLNYAYWLTASNAWPQPTSLICDEAHQLSELVLEWAGITIEEFHRGEYELPSFPIISGAASHAVHVKGQAPLDKAAVWLHAVQGKLEISFTRAASRGKEDAQARKRARRIERLLAKVTATLDAIEVNPDLWYLRSGPNALGDGKWGFVAKPLTARHHFQYYFGGPWQTYIMSATIGNAEVFATELGLDSYDFRRVPSNWAPESRPIYALDVPRLGMKSSPEDWDRQADQIVKAIRSVDDAWSGLIHTTSMVEAERLTVRLARKGLAGRVIVSERKSTHEIAGAWRAHLRRHPNAILVSWALHEGYDGTEEKINIIAKTPYPNLGSPYEKERQRFDGKMYLQRAAWTMEQMAGRTRRGNPDDYDTPDEKRGLVAFADGGWKWVQGYFSESARQSIRTDL
jgi:Rad3-related DNA helicase